MFPFHPRPHRLLHNFHRCCHTFNNLIATWLWVWMWVWIGTTQISPLRLNSTEQELNVTMLCDDASIETWFDLLMNNHKRSFCLVFVGKKTLVPRVWDPSDVKAKWMANRSFQLNMKTKFVFKVWIMMRILKQMNKCKGTEHERKKIVYKNI